MSWYIGTSGFMINKDIWLKKSGLNCLEINYTFYRLPKAETVQKWKEYEDVSFVAKIPKKITHIKRLKDIEKYWDLFWSIMNLLEDKLKVVLFQLPPSFKLTDENIKRLKNLKKILPKKGINIVFEFRDISWFVPTVYKIMKKNNWGMAGTVIKKKEDDISWLGTMPNGILLPPQTSDLTYLRIHGAKKYKGAYDIKELKQMQKEILNRKTKENFVLFNNTFFTSRSQYCLKGDVKIKSAAVCNAIEMKDLI
ncbi:Protein of unknown function DUF72 [seawater metagenome]|uniref:DUF72 domain-containing protein n=1 Tax=seawater metagenome TaxID=1561972 RepID=A0A5E8CJF6_9ZZZZ